MPHVFQLVRIIPPQRSYLTHSLFSHHACVGLELLVFLLLFRYCPLPTLCRVHYRLFCSLVCAKAGILCGPVGAWSTSPQAFLPLVLPVSKQEGKKDDRVALKLEEDMFYSD